MLFQRTCPKGIDFGIHILQKELFIELTKLGWADYDSYDRAYRNKKGDDKLPEVYLKDGEYREVLFNDKETVTSFFLADEKRSFDIKENLFTQGISIIFQANLDKLLPNVTNRADEEMINQITQALKKKFWGNRLVEVITGYERVYDSLKVSYPNKEYDDMGSFCIARFNFKMLYLNEPNKIIFIKS